MGDAVERALTHGFRMGVRPLFFDKFGHNKLPTCNFLHAELGKASMRAKAACNDDITEAALG
jgi:hypothetical protein